MQLEESHALLEDACNQKEEKDARIEELEEQLESLQQDPHLRDVGFFERVEHPTEGGIWNMRPANKLSGGARSDFTPAPKLGQHTCEILAEAGRARQYPGSTM